MDWEQLLYGDTMSAFELFGLMMGVGFVAFFVYTFLFLLVCICYHFLQKIFYTPPMPRKSKYVSSDFEVTECEKKVEVQNIQ